MPAPVPRSSQPMATLSTGSPSVICPILRMEGCSRCVPSVICPVLRIGTRYIGRSGGETALLVEYAIHCLNYARINHPSKTFQLEILLDPKNLLSTKSPFLWMTCSFCHSCPQNCPLLWMTCSFCYPCPQNRHFLCPAFQLAS